MVVVQQHESNEDRAEDEESETEQPLQWLGGVLVHGRHAVGARNVQVHAAAEGKQQPDGRARDVDADDEYGSQHDRRAREEVERESDRWPVRRGHYGVTGLR